MTKHAMNWHPADIRAAVAKRGATLSQVMRAAGLPIRAGSLVLTEPTFAAEQAIAAFLDIPAQEIWPGRYDSEGVTLQPRIRKQLNAADTALGSQKRRAA